MTFPPLRNGHKPEPEPPEPASLASSVQLIAESLAALAKVADSWNEDRLSDRRAAKEWCHRTDYNKRKPANKYFMYAGEMPDR